MRLLHWIISLSLLLAPTLAPAQKAVLVKAESLTLRGKPSKTAPAITKLVTYQPVSILSHDKEWTQVKTTQGQTGWVLSSYLTSSAFVLSDQETLNARRGPGAQFELWIEYKRKNLPLCVLDVASNGWLKVMDYEGDRGWISPKAVKASPHYVIVRRENSNIRKGVGATQELAFVAEKGVILEAVEEKEGWLRVRHTDGDEGWISAKLVFGWLDEEDSKAKTKASAGDSESKKEEASAKKETSVKKTKGTTSSKAGSKNKSSSAKKSSTKSKTKSSGKSSGDDEAKASTVKKSSSSAHKSATSSKRKISSSASEEESSTPVRKRSTHKKTSTTSKAANPIPVPPTNRHLLLALQALFDPFVSFSFGGGRIFLAL